MTDIELDPKDLLLAKAAIARVKAKSTGSRLQSAHMYPEVVKLIGEGWSRKKIAQHFKVYGGPGTDHAIAYIINRQAPKEVTGPADVDERHKWMLRWSVDSFVAFVKEFGPWEVAPHQRSWVEAFLRERNLLLNVPPGHGKSEIFMVWVPIWLICRDRNVQILEVSNSAEDAGYWGLEVAGQLEFNEGLIQAYGRFAPENVGDQKWTSRGVFSVMGRTRKMKGAQFTMESRGMGGRVLGRRADFIVVDDPTKHEDAISPAQRESQLAHLRQQVFTRAEPEGDEWKGGRIAVIGQRVHMLDLYGELEKQEWTRGEKRGTRVWHTEKYPAVLDWENKITLWPKKWTWDEIEVAYARVGTPNAFETMYQQNPVPEGSALVTQEQIDACKDWSRPAGVGFKKSSDGFPPIVKVLSVDPSPTKFNGIIVGDLAVSRDSFAFAVTHVGRMKAGIEQVKAECDRLIDQFRPDYFVFEESGFLAWFRNDPWFHDLENRVGFIRHHTGANKNHVEYGVQSLAGDFQFERISLPYGDDDARRMTDMLVNEALQYPDGDTYDTLMALWFIKFNYKHLRPRGKKGSYMGSGRGQGWSFLKGIKDRKENQDYAYREYMRQMEKARRQAQEQKELNPVG
jgi:hypothetical protein